MQKKILIKNISCPKISRKKRIKQQEKKNTFVRIYNFGCMNLKKKQRTKNKKQNNIKQAKFIIDFMKRKKYKPNRQSGLRSYKEFLIQ